MLLNVRDLCEKHQVAVAGIVHIGAHLAEEKTEYEQMTRGPICWVEGHPAPELETICHDSQHKTYFRWIGDAEAYKDKPVNFFQASNGQSSSLKLPLLHRKYHPEVQFTEQVSDVPVTTLSHFMQHVAAPDVFDRANLLCMDIQGSEGDAILGAQPIIHRFSAIYMEVNVEHLYADIMLMPQMDEILRRWGFIRLDTAMTPYGWGDAFYKRF